MTIRSRELPLTRLDSIRSSFTPLPEENTARDEKAGDVVFERREHDCNFTFMILNRPKTIPSEECPYPCPFDQDQKLVILHPFQYHFSSSSCFDFIILSADEGAGQQWHVSYRLQNAMDAIDKMKIADGEIVTSERYKNKNMDPLTFFNFWVRKWREEYPKA